MDLTMTHDETIEVTPRDWVIADAGWTWTERIFSPLAGLGQNVLLLDVVDWGNAWRQRRGLSRCLGRIKKQSERLWRADLALPPGWMKRLPRLGMRPIAGIVHRWRRLRDDARPLVLVASYPHYEVLADMVRPDHLVYYNMDDYALYWPDRADEVRDREDRIVARAELSIICASARAEELARRVPEAADRIRHCPHGAPASAIPARPQESPAAPPDDVASLPRPYLGFVGSLEDRLDWSLIEHLAREFPTGSVILIGRPPVGPGPWDAARDRPNVHFLGWRDQAQVGRYNASFDVCLIPYRVDHPFNLACCPTKIMDYMATTRPVVATALPECRLYADHFDVIEDADEFVAAVARIVGQGSDDGRSGLRWEHARAHTWERVAESVLEEFEARAGGPFGVRRLAAALPVP
jgi:glycosyltransferase involved in cell wall biosynthesis